MIVGQSTRLLLRYFHRQPCFQPCRSPVAQKVAHLGSASRLRARQATARPPPTTVRSAPPRDPTRSAWALKYGDEVQIYAAPNHRTFHLVAYATGLLWTAIGLDTLLRAYDKRSGYWATLLNEGIALVTAFLAFRAFKSPHRLIKEIWLERPKTAGNTATLRVVRQHHISLLGQKPVQEAAVSYATITRHYDPISGEELPRDVRLMEHYNAQQTKRDRGLAQTFSRVKEEMPYVYFWKAAPSTAYVSLPKEKSFFTRSEEQHFKLDGRGIMAARDGIIGLNVLPLREDL